MSRMRLKDELRFGMEGFPLDSDSRVESRSDSKKSDVVLQFDELFVDSIAVDASWKWLNLIGSGYAIDYGLLSNWSNESVLFS